MIFTSLNLTLFNWTRCESFMPICPGKSYRREGSDSKKTEGRQSGLKTVKWYATTFSNTANRQHLNLLSCHPFRLQSGFSRFSKVGWAFLLYKISLLCLSACFVCMFVLSVCLYEFILFDTLWVVSIGLFWFCFMPFMYNRVCFLWQTFSST